MDRNSSENEFFIFAFAASSWLCEFVEGTTPIPLKFESAAEAETLAAEFTVVATDVFGFY